MLFAVVLEATGQAKPVFYTIGNGATVAVGKWKATTGRPGDELAFKHAVRIECSKSRGECLEATANIVDGEPDVSPMYYTVVRWDANGIIAEDSSAKCMTNQLSINFKEGSVMAIDAPKSGSTKRIEAVCNMGGVDDTQTYKLFSQYS